MGNGHNRTFMGPFECKGTIWRGPLRSLAFCEGIFTAALHQLKRLVIKPLSDLNWSTAPAYGTLTTKTIRIGWKLYNAGQPDLSVRISAASLVSPKWCQNWIGNHWKSVGVFPDCPFSTRLFTTRSPLTQTNSRLNQKGGFLHASLLQSHLNILLQGKIALNILSCQELWSNGTFYPPTSERPLPLRVSKPN